LKLMSRFLRNSKSKVSSCQRLLISLAEALGGTVSKVDFRCIQDDRGTIRQQWKRLLHREKEAFYIDVEYRVIELLSNRAEGGKLCHAGIREHNIELAHCSAAI
jgi:hypothetical protein